VTYRKQSINPLPNSNPFPSSNNRCGADETKVKKAIVSQPKPLTTNLKSAGTEQKTSLMSTGTEKKTVGNEGCRLDTGTSAVQELIQGDNLEARRNTPTSLNANEMSKHSNETNGSGPDCCEEDVLMLHCDADEDSPLYEELTGRKRSRCCEHLLVVWIVYFTYMFTRFVNIGIRYQVL